MIDACLVEVGGRGWRRPHWWETTLWWMAGVDGVGSRMLQNAFEVF
jgi:hypothetical protein